MSHVFLTSLAMLAFATNSILCRMALDGNAIDAAAFTSIRLLSGAVTLAGILIYRTRGFTRGKVNPASSLMLYIYAVCFSFSYVQLSAGTGALILFGAVQLTMVLFGLAKGERHGGLGWTGIVAACGGLVYLLLPGVNRPSPSGALLMTLAGIAWGIYTLRGRTSNTPLSSTGWNFIGTVPLALLTLPVFWSGIHLTYLGITLAMISGALASGIGYVLWYGALPHLTPTGAATVQLSVPVIAAFGGVLLLAEPLTARLIIASLVVLGGIYLTIHATAAGSRPAAR
jgi:drug/metabolite transporter (DMT)-like permease